MLVNALTLSTLPALFAVMLQVLATSRACRVLLVAASAPPLIVPLTLPVPVSVKPSVLVPPVRFSKLLKVVPFTSPALGAFTVHVLATFAPMSVSLAVPPMKLVDAGEAADVRSPRGWRG